MSRPAPARVLTTIVICLLAAAASIARAQEPKWIAPARATEPGPEPKWIWVETVGQPAPTSDNAPAGRAIFVREFEAPAGVVAASLRVAADNSATVSLNAEEVLRSTSWATPAHVDVRVREGKNLLVIDATNDAAPQSSRNPGGVALSLEMVYADGTTGWVATDEAWVGRRGESGEGLLGPVVVLGPVSVAPWSLSPSAFDAPAPCPMLRRTLTLDALPVPTNNTAAPSPASVRIIGLGHYELRCNGQVVGDSVINQAWSEYDAAIYWQEFDLRPHLRVGENVLAVTLGNSFWRVDAPNDSGRFAKTDAMPDFSEGQPHLLWLDASITTPRGIVRVVSDETWTWADSPLTFSHIYAGEDYDARLAQPGWDTPGFIPDAGASTWRTVTVAPAPKAEIRPLVSPTMQAFETFAPTEIKRPAPGLFTYVFPQNCSALLRFTLSGGKAGDRVRFRPCEYMDESGRVKFTYTWGTGKDIWHDYTKSSGGTESHQTLFCFVGAQFVQVEGAVPKGDPNPDNLPVIESLEQVHVRAACPVVGSFTSSSPIQNAAHGIIDWAIGSNMAHVPTDCPHREKNGWIEQTWHMARSISYTYDVNAWFAKTCADIGDTQQPDGHIPTNCPNYLVGVPPHGFWNNAPEWGIAGVLLPWHLYEWYGDRAVLEKSYDSAARYIDYLASTAKDGIITSNLGDWYDFGHGKGNGPSQWTPNEVSATAIWAYGAKTMADAARVLDKPDDAAKYDALFNQIRADFQRHFYDAATKTVTNKGSCQAANAAALCVGLVPEADRDACLDAVIADLESRGWKQTPGEVLQIFLIRALADAGRADVLHRIYSRDDIPSYGHMVKSGLTTLPESWDARRGTGDSLNHFMLGHLMEWHYACVAGIRQAQGSVGWREIVIAPQIPPRDLLEANPEAIRSCDATFNSPRGTITSQWSLDGETFTLTCTVPEGVRATAVMPDGTTHDVRGEASFRSAPDRAMRLQQRSIHPVPTEATDQHGMPFTISGMSGITWLSGDDSESTFAVVLDNADKIVRLRVGFSPDGSIARLDVADGLTLASKGDHEGVAFTNAAANSAFVSDEVGPAITEFDLSTGASLRTLAVPSIFTEPGNLRPNFGFESLTQCPETSDLWTANEESLTVDGPRSTPERGTLVRLTRLHQAAGAGAPTPSRQLAYLTDPLHGMTIRSARSGVSDIVAISRGRLLILERSFARGAGLFKNSIYLVDPAEDSPTDIASIASLDRSTFTPVTKRLLWSAYLNQNLEGLCLGPELSPTSRVLLGVVDDADPLSMNMAVSFELIDSPTTATPAAATDNAAGDSPR